MVTRVNNLCFPENTQSRVKRGIVKRQAPGCELSHVDCQDFALSSVCASGSGVGTCMNGDVQCQVRFLYQNVTSPPSQSQTVTCGDCVTAVVVEADGVLQEVAYQKGSGTVMLVPPNPNNPPEGCVRGGAGAVVATSLTLLMVLANLIH